MPPFLLSLESELEMSQPLLVRIPLCLPNTIKTEHLVPLVHNVGLKATIGALVVILQSHSYRLVVHNPRVHSFPPDANTKETYPPTPCEILEAHQDARPERRREEKLASP